MNIKDQFFVWFHTKFAFDPMMAAMLVTVENSPWHREANVAVHTGMVVAEYLKISPTDWTIDDLCGGFACAFHDVGKPAARTEKQSEARGVYYSYPGHEQISARLWEDWAVTNWNTLSDMGLQYHDIYRVGWMIEHHLPYKTEKLIKRELLSKTVSVMVGTGTVFGNVLLADQYGRVSDELETNRAKVTDWVVEFRMQCVVHKLHDSNISDNPSCFILIGPSGCGKSTFTKRLEACSVGNCEHYSWDALRLQWYSGNTGDAKNDYKIAFQGSVDDPQFNQKTQVEFNKVLETKNNIIVDNTNLTAKRRRAFADAAHRKGYNVVGVVFPISIYELERRHASRADKHVPWETVKGMYMSVQYPSYGEVDTVITVK